MRGRITLLLLILCASYVRGAVVCTEYEYTEGDIHPAVYGTRPYQYANLAWIVDPPINIELHGGDVVLSYVDFAQSYPWARDVLKEYSTLKRYSLGLVKLDPPGESPGCVAWIDSVNMYWDIRPVANMFTLYTVRCDYTGQLMFGVDPAAHPVKDNWGPNPRWPTDGKHFAPRGGRSSFESMIARVNQGKPDYTTLTLAYHSGAEPHIAKLSVRTCVDVDMPGLAAALVKRYNDTVSEVERSSLAKRSAELIGPTQDPDLEPAFDSEADKDRWVLDQLRKSGVRVDLPLEGKRAPPPPPPPPAVLSPYEGNAVDDDAIVRPGQQLGQAGDVAKVVGSANADQAILDGLLWPVLECVKDANDGTCIAFFGYHLASDTAVNVSVKAEEDNWFDPQEFLTDFDRDQPTHFEPGYHEKAFVIRWLCDKLSGFKEIHWTLKGSTASAQETSPDCDSAEEGDKLVEDARLSVEKARAGSSIRKLFGINDGDAEHTRVERRKERDGPPDTSTPVDTTTDPIAQTTTPPPQTIQAASSPSDSSSSSDSGGSSANCTDTGACDGLLQPRLECTHNFENGTCVSYFGYLNLGNVTVHRDPSLAANNFFTPIDEDQGQPGDFLPGRQYYVVTVYWFCQLSSGPPGSISWVMNTTATASSATHNTCPVGCDDIPFSNATDCPTTSSSELSTLGSSGIAMSSTESSSSSSSSSSTGSSFTGSSSSSSSTGIIPTPCPPPPVCQYGATLELFRNRNFTKPYRPPTNELTPHLAVNAQPYGLVKLQVPNDWLADFCIDVTEVVQCLCNASTPCHPFDPLHPGVTGCNSPGVAKRILYRESPLVENDGFGFVEDPPTYCSGARAFTWTQQMVAPPGSKLLVQSKWSYTTQNGNQHNCTGQSQGGSGAVFNCCNCPSTHNWNTGCGCCMPIIINNNGGGNTTVNVNVTVINVINMTIPDQSGTGVTAIAAATASVAVATATASATSTTGNIVIIIDQSKPHWWGWLLIGLASAIALPCLLCALWFLGAILFPPVPVATPDYELALVEDEPQPVTTDTITIVDRTAYTGYRIPEPQPVAAERHHLDFGGEYSYVNGELVKKTS